MKFGAIITAGGNSARFGSNKLIEKINGKEVIKYSVETFLNSGIDEIVICGGEYLKELFPDIKVVKGGKTRQESVYNGLCSVNCDYVLIHDGARPMITSEIINSVKSAVIEKKAISVMTKTIDTIKEVDDNGKIIITLDRSKLYNTQTPQAFEYNLIKSVHEKLKGQNFTDDAGMVEFLNQDVYMVEGCYKNIKITTKSDIALAEMYLLEK
ncbi:2-C-methyl-D-erythritol 4-phosphate cytidylyltransferase [bacterium]|nr:2-C-methyl-D-erythritol 4-phosphate cytidylyltransferase [bacterium]